MRHNCWTSWHIWALAKWHKWFAEAEELIKECIFPTVQFRLPVPVFSVPGLAEAMLRMGGQEKGPGRRLTSCCSSPTFFFIIEANKLRAWPYARGGGVEFHLRHRSVETPKVWGFAGEIFFQHGPIKQGGYSRCMIEKETAQHESKSALRPTYLTWGRSISPPRLIQDLCRLIKPKEASPEVVLSVEVVKEAGGGHARGERLVPHPRCTSCSDGVALAMQRGTWWASTHRPNKQSSSTHGLLMQGRGLHGILILSSKNSQIVILSAFGAQVPWRTYQWQIQSTRPKNVS